MVTVDINLPQGTRIEATESLIKEIEKISDTETNVLATLISVWKASIYSPYRIQPKILKSATLNFEKTKLDVVLEKPLGIGIISGA